MGVCQPPSPQSSHCQGRWGRLDAWAGNPGMAVEGPLGPGLRRMGRITAGAVPQMGFQDGAGTSWDLP